MALSIRPIIFQAVSLSPEAMTGNTVDKSFNRINYRQLQ